MRFQGAPKVVVNTSTWILCVAACLLFGMAPAPAASAQNFVVNSTADRVDISPGDKSCDTGQKVGKTAECTLRAAVDEINALSKSGAGKSYTVTLSPGTYFLTTSESCVYEEPGDINLLTRTTTSLCVNGNMTLTGADAATSIIDGGLASRIFVIGRASTVAVNHVTLQNAIPLGDEFDGGGAAFNNEGSLSLAGDLFTMNQAGATGGVIYNAAKLIVDNCVFEGNFGSAIVSSTFDGLNDTSVNDSYFYNNTALQGPAVFVFGGARAQISNSTMSGNTAEQNGVIFIYNTPSTITNTTVSFNTIQNSGAVVSSGNATTPMTLNNDTIYGNTPINTIGGLMANHAIVSNTIISNNGDIDCAVDNLTDLGHNIIGRVLSNTANICKTGSLTTIGVDPRLGPLQLDGGQFPTQTPLAGSPAIGKGSPSVPGLNAAGACAALDERGLIRGKNGPCTIGAAEALNGLQIANILPSRGGAGAVVTVTIHGSGFVPGSTLTLRQAGTSIPVTQTEVSEDATSIAATLDLATATLGAYDVEIKTADSSTILTAGFAVQAAVAPNLYAYVTGELSGREGQPNSLTLVYGNTGNVDAYLVPATLSLPGNFVTTFSNVVPPPAASGQVIHDWSKAPVDVTPYSLNGSTNTPLIIPVIPANSQGVLLFTTTPPVGANLTVPYNIYAGLGDPYGMGNDGHLSPDLLTQFVAGAQSYAQTNLGVSITAAQLAKMSDYAATQLSNVVDSGAQALLQSQGGRPLFYSHAQLVIDIAEYGASLSSAKSSAANRAKTLITPSDTPPGSPSHGPTYYCVPGAVMQEGTSCAPPEPASPNPGGDNPNVDGFIARADCIHEIKHHVSGNGKLCLPDNPKVCAGLHDPNCGTFRIRASLDPNQKTGPLGVGTAGYLTAVHPSYYEIEFENSPTATGAAQTVTVTDPLDLKRFDGSSLQLGAINFGKYLVTPPPGLTSFSTALDLRPDQNVIVSILANLNASSGVLTWNFVSLDPGTLQLTTDANAGFLPPDTLPPAGIGHVAFTVSPIKTLPDGQICNTASITFDTNKPIATAPFCNVKDTTAPTSHVLVLPGSTPNPTFTVSWTGADAGSGVQSYSIFVSDNGGPFAPFLTSTTTTSASFTGTLGHQYGFYSIATDELGNTEPAKRAAESTTNIGTVANTPVPNVVGFTQANAVTALTGATLSLGTVSLQYSATIASGNVISQNPAAGTKVAAKSAVNLVVSSGPAPVVVPAVIGLTQAAATASLSAVGLVVGTVSLQASPTVAAGLVLSESPAAGTSVVTKSAVRLVVSSGPAPVKVPNVVGATQATASTAITSAGLVLGSITVQSSATIAAGLVISESPTAGTSVAANSAVRLVVSSGAAPVTVPNVVGVTQGIASSSITTAGLILGTVTNASSATVAAGLVISENPAAGSKVAPKSAVNLVVSNGPVVGDVNGDGVVNCADLAIVKASFGKSTGQAGFDARADVNHDGIVNILDLSTVSRAMPSGTTCN